MVILKLLHFLYFTLPSRKSRPCLKSYSSSLQAASRMGFNIQWTMGRTVAWRLRKYLAGYLCFLQLSLFGNEIVFTDQLFLWLRQNIDLIVDDVTLIIQVPAF